MKIVYALILTVAAAGFGCTYATSSPAKFKDMQLQPETSQETLPESKTDETGDTIVPENTSPEVAETPPETETEADAEPETEDEGGESFCPTGWVSQGTATLCCRIDDPQTCMIVDPGPGDGGVKPTVGGILPVDGEIVVDPTPPDEPTPPPPPPGGGIQDPDAVNCFDGDSSDDTRRRRPVGTQPGSDEVVDRNDCIRV